MRSGITAAEVNIASVLAAATTMIGVAQVIVTFLKIVAR